ncbi:MAG: TRAP transporter substrate-binding protein DctP, partial [Candidatus Goldbacteria bacterium]|nr:TRAP transporter substrate-binding protein DctP [Candidatus Goldiibacteriota bacterium]
DIIAQKTFENFGASPIPVSIADVMTSIQTGMSDTVYATPATILPLGWHKKMNYILDIPITYGTGAVLISKEVIERMDNQTKDIFLKTAKKYFSDLNKISRQDNLKSLELLKKQLKPTKPKKLEEFEEISIKTRKELVSFYGSNLLEKIEKELTVYRNVKSKNNKN